MGREAPSSGGPISSSGGPISSSGDRNPSSGGRNSSSGRSVTVSAAYMERSWAQRGPSTTGGCDKGAQRTGARSSEEGCAMRACVYERV
eukprot:6194431-Pleurochrysis_carterae.AAC.1